MAEHVALQLQRDAGTEVGRGKTRSTGTPGRYHVVFSYAEESVGIAAGKLAVRLVNNLVQREKGFDFAAEFEQLVRLAERAAFGPSTQALLDEAGLRDIPWIRLNEASLVQLGHGVHQRRIRATMTSNTSSLGVDIASERSSPTSCWREPAFRCRGPRWSATPTRRSWPRNDPLPRGGQAARRQPRPGRDP